MQPAAPCTKKMENRIKIYGKWFARLNRRLLKCRVNDEQIFEADFLFFDGKLEVRKGVKKQKI